MPKDLSWKYREFRYGTRSSAVQTCLIHAIEAWITIEGIFTYAPPTNYQKGLLAKELAKLRSIDKDRSDRK